MTPGGEASRAAPTGLDAFVAPRSVAVVGASDDPTAWGHHLARGALEGAHRRDVHLVNARAAEAGATVLGRPAVRSLLDLETVDLVAVAVPGPHVPAVVADGLARGARGFVVVSADLDGTGDDEARRQAEDALAAQVRAGGARLLGPSTLGLVDAAAELRLAWGRFPAGPVALVSQSGQVGIEIAALLETHGLGLSRFVSVGSRDVGMVDVLRSLVDHGPTRAVAVYAESLGDARELAAAAAALRGTGRTVVLLAPGSSEAGARAAGSHTAALVSGDAVVEAVARAGGMVRVRTPAALVAACAALAQAPSSRGPRVGVVSDSGGQGVIAADALSAAGLVVPALPEPTRTAIAAALPSARAVATNPVDLVGSGETDLHSYARAVEVLAASGDVDAVLLTGYFGRYSLDSPGAADVAATEVEVAGRIAAVAATTGRAVVVHAMAAHGSPAVEALRAGSVPVVDRVDDAAVALAALGAMPADPPADPPTGSPASGTDTPAAQPLSDTDASGYARARALLAARDVAFPPAVVLAPSPQQADQAVAAAASLRTRVVVKATSLQHKTEHDAVVLDLVGDTEVRAAVDDLRSRLGDVEVTVEAMARPESGVELLVGARRDPVAGPVVTVAAGGVGAEADPDVALRLAPVDLPQARAMLDSLRLAPLLAGWRGREPLDVEAAAACVVAVGDVLVQHPHLTDLEVNPLLVTAQGAVALDAWAASDPEPEEPR